MPSFLPALLAQKRPLIMGIVNMTPDSFSGDGLFTSDHYIDDAVRQGVQMVQDGADILDIGGESTRPNAAQVDVAEELRRTAPVIAALHRALPQVPLSIDTTKPVVAKAALEAGATIINDVSGARQAQEMRLLAAQSGAYLVLMHNAAQRQETTNTQTVGGEYVPSGDEKSVAGIVVEMGDLVGLALKAGIAKEKIIIDPGVGFGKTLKMNLQLINELDAFHLLGFPVLLGVSRKSFIGRVLDVPADERLEGTAAAIVIGALRGASILRVHDVRFMARVARMTKALQDSGL